MPTRISLAFVNRDQKLRNGWWLATFFLVLATLLFLAILATAHFKREVTLWEPLGLIAIVTAVVQMLRRKPVTEVMGAMDRRWIAGFAVGAVLGGLLMALPALGLVVAGCVRFEFSTSASQTLANAIALMLAVALAEELLFRGRAFPTPDRWAWGLAGATKVWAGCNIFLASMQGVILGFGVSGESERNMFLSAPIERSGAAGGLQSMARLTGQTTGVVIMTLLVSALPLEAAPRIGLAIGALLSLMAGVLSTLHRPASGPGAA